MIDTQHMPDQMEFLCDIPTHIISPVVIPYLADALDSSVALGLALQLLRKAGSCQPGRLETQAAATLIEQAMQLHQHRQDAFYRAAMRA